MPYKSPTVSPLDFLSATNDSSARPASESVRRFGECIQAIVAGEGERARALLHGVRNEMLYTVAEETAQIAEKARELLAGCRVGEALAYARECPVEEVADTLEAEILGGEYRHKIGDELFPCMMGDLEAIEDFANKHQRMSRRVARSVMVGLRKRGIEISASFEDLAQNFWTDFVADPGRMLRWYDASKGAAAPWLSMVMYNHMRHYAHSRSKGIRADVPLDHDFDVRSIPQNDRTKSGARYTPNDLQSVLADPSLDKDTVNAYCNTHGIFSHQKEAPATMANRQGISPAAMYKRLERLETAVIEIMNAKKNLLPED